MGWTSLQEDIAARHDDLGHMLRKFDSKLVDQPDTELTGILAACRRLLDQITKIAKTAATPSEEIALRLVSAEARVVDLQLQLEQARQTNSVTKRQLAAEREINTRRDAPLLKEIDDLRRRLEKSKLTSAGKASRLKAEAVAAKRATYLIHLKIPEDKQRSNSKRKKNPGRNAPNLGGMSLQEKRNFPPESRSTKTQKTIISGKKPKASS